MFMQTSKELFEKKSGQKAAQKTLSACVGKTSPAPVGPARVGPTSPIFSLGKSVSCSLFVHLFSALSAFAMAPTLANAMDTGAPATQTRLGKKRGLPAPRLQGKTLNQAARSMPVASAIDKDAQQRIIAGLNRQYPMPQSAMTKSVQRLFQQGRFRANAVRNDGSDQVSGYSEDRPWPAMTLSQYGAASGRPMLILFWGRNCPPCLGELGKISALKTALVRRGVQADILPICLDPITQANELPVTPLYESVSMNPYLENTDQGALNVRSIPFALVVGSDGSFLGYTHVGYMDFEQAEVQDELAIQLVRAQLAARAKLKMRRSRGPAGRTKTR
jgi:hypothetical protein